jgi:hypothetical protein
MLIYAAYNAQGSRGIIVAEQVGAVKRRYRQGETQETIKIDGFLRFTPPLETEMVDDDSQTFFKPELAVLNNVNTRPTLV